MTQFTGKFSGLRLFQLGNAGHRLWIQHFSSLVVVDLAVIGPDSFHQLSHSTFVSHVNLCKGQRGACLPVDQLPQPGFPLDAIEDFHLGADIMG